MAGWEEELAILLRELGVKQEETRTPLQSTRKPMHSDVKQRDQFADAILWNEENDSDEDKDDLWIDDLSTMRQEVDSIVRQVILLMQRGGLESSLKEDVMVVLRALRRRAVLPQPAVTTDEVYLESASAMLHFCRLILQLSEFATEDS